MADEKKEPPKAAEGAGTPLKSLRRRAAGQARKPSQTLPLPQAARTGGRGGGAPGAPAKPPAATPPKPPAAAPPKPRCPAAQSSRQARSVVKSAAG